MIANRHWKNSRVGADADLVSDFGRLPIIWRRRRNTCLKTIIDKHYSMRNEAAISNGDELTDEGMRLDPATFADNGPLLDLNEWSDERIVTY